MTKSVRIGGNLGRLTSVDWEMGRMDKECGVKGSPRQETGTNKKIELICVVGDFVGGGVRHPGGVGSRRSRGDGEPSGSTAGVPMTGKGKNVSPT